MTGFVLDMPEPSLDPERFRIGHLDHLLHNLPVEWHGLRNHRNRVIARVLILSNFHFRPLFGPGSAQVNPIDSIQLDGFGTPGHNPLWLSTKNHHIILEKMERSPPL